VLLNFKKYLNQRFKCYYFYNKLQLTRTKLLMLPLMNLTAWLCSFATRYFRIYVRLQLFALVLAKLTITFVASLLESTGAIMLCVVQLDHPEVYV